MKLARKEAELTSAPIRPSAAVMVIVTARTLNVGFTSDWLYTPQQNRDLVHALLRCGKDATYAQLDMTLGHDSFLLHSPELYALIRSFLEV